MADGSGVHDLAALVTPPERVQGDAPLFLADRYRVLGPLGRGGAATVYRAHDLMLGRDVAVKVLAPVEPADDELLRHAAEMTVLSSLRHPALVTLFDAGTDPVAGGALVRGYLVMELVSGPTLARRLNDGPLDARQTARVGWAVAGALAAVHAHDVVHRDVKPANVLLTGTDAIDVDVDGPFETPPVKLADFGIARIAAATRLTVTGAILGTATYLSPEQATGSTLGPATDVYSLGLVLLECLTGRAAFVGTVAEVAAARLARDPEVPPAVHPGLGWLIRRMTARNPEARPTAAQVRDELESLLVREMAVWTAPIAVAAALPAAAPLPVAAAVPADAPLSVAARVAADGPTPTWAEGATEPISVVAASPPRGVAAPARRRRAALIGLAAAIVLVSAIAAATAWRAHGQQSAAEATALTWTAGLESDVAGLRSAIADGRLDTASALLDDARRELAAARGAGALPEARLAAFAATFDGASQQIAEGLAAEAATAAAAQVPTDAAVAAVQTVAPAPAAAPAKPATKHSHSKPGPGPARPKVHGGP